MQNDERIDLLADEINRREADLVVLRQAFEILGGTYEEDAATEKPKRKYKSKKKKAASAKPDEFGVTLDGQFVKLRERQAAVVELLLSANGAPASKRAIAIAWGSPVNFQATFNSINKQLAAVGQVAAVVRGQGYQLQKI